MNIAILSTGDELMQGVILNTNEQWLSEYCRKLGHEVVARATVADDIKEIGDALKWLMTKADIILVSGGLGPTADDITLEAAAKAFNTKLVFHQEILEKIRAQFQAAGKEMTASNERQAWLPEHSCALYNNFGTAPGVHWRVHERDVFFMPGVPKELYFIFEHSIVPWLKARAEQNISERVLRCFGMPEATIDTHLQDLDLQGARLSFRIKYPEVLLKVWLAGDSKQTTPTLQSLVNAMKMRLGDVIYAEGDATLPELVAEKLSESQQTLAVAESCTGGYLSHLLTNIPGSSNWFLQGVVSYSEAAKEELLHVSHALVRNHGVISKEVAAAMAEGVRERSGATWGIGITGIAGPDGGTKEKPVGTVFIALAGKDKIKAHEFHFPRSREEFKVVTAWTALALLKTHFPKANSTPV